MAILCQDANISGYGIVALDSTFYIFGGYYYHALKALFSYGGASTVASFDTNTKEWKKLGYLRNGRRGHAVTIHKGQFIVIGGYPGSFRTERCALNGGSIYCATVGPELVDYEYYPEIMSVSEKYCPK